jgi:hypothetical protein
MITNEQRSRNGEGDSSYLFVHCTTSLADSESKLFFVILWENVMRSY